MAHGQHDDGPGLRLFPLLLPSPTPFRDRTANPLQQQQSDDPTSSWNRVQSALPSQPRNTEHQPTVFSRDSKILRLKQHAVVRAEHAHQRDDFLVAQSKWMKALDAVFGSIKSVPGHYGNFSRLAELKKAYREMQDIAPRIAHYDEELGSLDREIESGDEHGQFTEPPAATQTHSTKTPRNPVIVVNKHDDDDTIVPAIDYADLYYENKSAVRYLSDNLINLGPRPSMMDGTAMTDEEHLDDPTDGSPAEMASYQYAKNHLQLLKDIEFRNVEAAKYKALCVENNIRLDDEDESDSDDGDVSDSDDIYQSLLYDQAYATSRLESLVAVNQGHQQHPADVSVVSGTSIVDARISAWATGLPPQAESLVSDPAPLADPTLNSSLGMARFHHRRPSRRRSISPALVSSSTTTTSLSSRKHRVSSPISPLSDSGIYMR